MKLKDYTGGGGGSRVGLLLVDDEPAFLEQAELFLEREHDRLDIDAISSASDALELLEDSSYECVVSDYQMPEMDGLELLRTVREERGSDIPFIIFTGKGREEVAMEALNLGANRYLQKGGDPESQYEVLAQAVLQEVQHHRSERKRAEFGEELRQAREFRLALGDAPVALGFYDRDRSVRWANKAYREAANLTLQELKGRKCYRAWGLDEPCDNCPVAESVEAGEPREAELIPGDQDYWRSDQEPRLSKVAPARDGDGGIVGVVEVFLDVIERVEARAEKRRREVVASTGEAISGGVIREFEARVSPSELGVKQFLEYMANLAVAPASPQSVFDLMVTGIQEKLGESGFDSDREEIREIITPHLDRFLAEVFSIADRLGEEIPAEYESLKDRVSARSSESRGEIT